jgi:hypothetical protein
LARVLLLLLGVACFAAGCRHFLVSWMDRVTSARVVGISRDFGSDLLGSNYQVYYEFFTFNKHTADGSYLLENPLTLGDVPRVGSYLQVRYSALDPNYNRPAAGDDLDLSGAVIAEFFVLAGLILLLAAWRAT